MPDWLTAPQVAVELELAERTVRDQLAAGVLRGQKPGRDWLVERREVARYRAEHLGRPGRRPAPKRRSAGKAAAA